jgi:hypothetical protein
MTRMTLKGQQKVRITENQVESLPDMTSWEANTIGESGRLFEKSCAWSGSTDLEQ